MVAISLYKGNLHKVPNVPRRWPRPTPKISLKDFKTLLQRRAIALSRLRSHTADAANDVATTSNPKPAPNSNPECGNTDPSSAGNAVNDSGGDKNVDYSRSERDFTVKRDFEVREGVKEEEKEKDERSVEKEDSLGKLVEKTDALVEEVKNEENVKNDVKADVSLIPVVEKINKENASSDVEKRKKEVQEKLEILNEKKHSLVQVLKQILNAEEQLKRQNSTQGMAGRPPLPLQVDTTTDFGSMIRVNTLRMDSDGNPCGDMELGEADAVSNHNVHSRQLPRTSSTSPSSDSQQGKPPSNMVPYSYRTTLGIAGSPSRFAPAGQGPPSVSVSGASFIASSPSPAASGGTSVFKDGRLPSPWN